MSRAGKRIKCSVYKESGHNKDTCKKVSEGTFRRSKLNVRRIKKLNDQI